MDCSLYYQGSDALARNGRKALEKLQIRFLSPVRLPFRHTGNSGLLAPETKSFGPFSKGRNEAGRSGLIRVTLEPGEADFCQYRFEGESFCITDLMLEGESIWLCSLFGW
jgi:hypothetical protein